MLFSIGKKVVVVEQEKAELVNKWIKMDAISIDKKLFDCYNEELCFYKNIISNTISAKSLNL
ncbi:hypothetical protein GCM10008015_05270 [Flavobacterium palustre]|uniref:Uncharacterized protein n=1 Tax=Flavobacterium palustre TaxID=1476463 RepID=A0ABQ1HB43_9FLAO|nr:hypothetical protein GCM10008015_05270 [Flavobacterium palustre]